MPGDEADTVRLRTDAPLGSRRPCPGRRRSSEHAVRREAARPQGCCSQIVRRAMARGLCGGYSYDSTSIRRPFDCLSKVVKVTVTQPASRSHADLFISDAFV